jgi:hypothetical protein
LPPIFLTGKIKRSMSRRENITDSQHSIINFILKVGKSPTSSVNMNVVKALVKKGYAIIENGQVDITEAGSFQLEKQINEGKEKLNSVPNPERSVARDDDSSTKVDKQNQQTK